MIQRRSGLADITGRLQRLFDLDGLPQWTALVYSNNWTDYGGGFAAGAAFRDPLGVVHLRGLIKRSTGSHTSNETIATLPVGMRPLAMAIFNQRIESGTCRVDVRTDGTIIVVDDPAPSAGTAEAYLSLDGISFRTS